MFNKLLLTLRSSLPAACIVCGQAALKDYGICTECERNMPRLGDCCRCCGVELRGAPRLDSCCKLCLRSPPSFDICKAAFPYVTPVDRLVAHFKFSGRFDVGYSLSRTLATTFNAHYCENDKPELLLPVPLHSSRLRFRGFNQATEICKVLSKYCQVATANSVLCKTRTTEAQTAMTSATARKSNLRGAFALRDLNKLKSVTHIALVDDVVTTMATVEILAKLLRSHRKYRIDVWCLARANL
tara:strand:- start:974 stop:1699 length:726 start_codon:yes stop_codon:yes gene_type:complete